MRNRQHRRSGQGGFTLLEILFAVMLMAIISAIAYMSFAAITGAWHDGLALSDDMHHGDYAMEQLVAGLRSVYYPQVKGEAPAFGFLAIDHGDGYPDADEISWVKVGSELVGSDAPYADSPHRVLFYVDKGEDGEPAAFVKSWSVHDQTEEFDPETDVEPVLLSRHVVGLNCRTAFEESMDGAIDWLDEWEETNRIPRRVELTLFLSPIGKDDEPVEIKRAFELPTAWLAWQGEDKAKEVK
jgi:prepilin-type N-terminal cleavage/methylation domain-containing protein